jgi:hypothetical protein
LDGQPEWLILAQSFPAALRVIAGFSPPTPTEICMQDSLRAALRRGLTISALGLAFAGATLAGALAPAAAADDQALAQAQPSPAPTPEGQLPGTDSSKSGIPAVGVPRPAGSPAPFGHLPIIDIVPIFTQPDAYAKASQIKAYDPIDVGGTVRFPITPNFSLSFDRLVDGLFNVPTEPYIGANGKPVYPSTTRDEKLLYRGDLVLKRFTVEAGFSFRQRDDAGGGNGVSDAPFPYTVSSTEHHYAYLGVTYRTPPVHALLNSSFLFNVNGYAQNVDHNVGALCSAALVAGGKCATAGSVYYIDEDPGLQRYYEMSETAAIFIPFKPGVIVTVSDTAGALNFYENAAGPYRWTSYDVEMITKSFSPTFSLSLRHQQLHQVEQGYPFPFPQGIDTGSYDIFATFHVDFNRIFH